MSFTTFIFKNLLRRKARSSLTIFGIAVAIAATTALLGAADDFQRSVLQSFENEGSDIVISPKGTLLQIAGDMDETIGNRIAQVPGVQEVSQGLIEQVAMDIDDNQVPVLVQGWKHGTYAFNDIDVQQGRILEATDQDAVILGTVLAQKLRAAVGDTIQISEEPFQVVGVFDSPTLLKRGSAVMLLHRLQRLMLREGSVTGFSVHVDPSMKDNDALVRQITDRIEALTDDEGNSLNLAASATADFVRDNFQLKITRGMAWVTSLIAVTVGAIGMLNTMIMSVMERVREISVLRAIGWRKSRVVAMIMGEAVVLSCLGALLGIVMAIVGSRVLAGNSHVNGFMSGHIASWVLATAAAIAICVGVAGAAYPAWRASRLQPSEGLRHE